MTAIDAWLTLSMIEEALRGVLSLRDMEIVSFGRPETNDAVRLLVRRPPHHYWSVDVPLTQDEQRLSDVGCIIHRMLEHIDAHIAKGGRDSNGRS